jgi:hypothetical protein
MAYNGRASEELNRVDALRCAVATVSALDRRHLKGKNIAELVIAIATSYEGWLNGQTAEMPDGVDLLEFDTSLGRE